jgi:hypothetical protein
MRYEDYDKDRKICANCKYLYSYEQMYCDLEEPSDQGECDNQESPKYRKAVFPEDNCKFFKSCFNTIK